MQVKSISGKNVCICVCVCVCVCVCEIQPFSKKNKDKRFGISYICSRIPPSFPIPRSLQGSWEKMVFHACSRSRRTLHCLPFRSFRRTQTHRRRQKKGDQRSPYAEQQLLRSAPPRMLTRIMLGFRCTSHSLPNKNNFILSN